MTLAVHPPKAQKPRAGASGAPAPDMNHLAALPIFSALLASTAVHAETATADRWTAWMQGDRALDGILPHRQELDDHGLYFGGTFTTDLLGNPVGGRRQGFTYGGLLQLIMVAELEKLLGVPGGYLVLSMADASGTDLSREYIGNYFHVGDVYALPTITLYQMYYEQRLMDEKVTAKIGRLNIGQDFAALDMFTLYVGGIDGHPPVFGYNTFWNGIGRPTWGGSLKLKPHDDWTLLLGVYQATTALRVPANHGLNMDFRPQDGVQLFGEIAWKNKLRDVWLDAPEGLTGTHKFGGYWSSWDYATFDGGATDQSFGFYWVGQQMVWRERAGADDGLTLWYAFSLAPDQNQALFPFFAGTGAGWQGALPGRDNDWILFGSYYGSVSRDFAAVKQDTGLGNPTYEWVLEWDYRAQLTPWLYVMPTIQWIIRPRALATSPAAFVLGAEIGVTF